MRHERPRPPAPHPPSKHLIVSPPTLVTPTNAQERLSKPTSSRSGFRSRDMEVGTTPPAVLQRVPATAAAAAAERSGAGRGAGARSGGLGPRSDVVFAVSSGVVSSYDDEGRLNWQDRRGPTWAKPGQSESVKPGRQSASQPVSQGLFLVLL